MSKTTNETAVLAYISDQVTITLDAITYGAMLGIFSLGLFFPWANTKGALIGGLTSLALVGWLVTGSQAAIARGAIKFPKKPVSTSCCLFNNVTEGTLSSTIGNITQVSRTSVDSESEQPFVLFRLSYLYFNVVGCVTVITVGLLVSLLTGPNHPRDVNPDLLSPVIHRWLPKNRNKTECADQLQELQSLRQTDD